jgi:preprotein translocase subunit SecD
MKWISIVLFSVCTCAFAADVSIMKSVLELKDLKTAKVHESRGVTVLDIELTEAGARKIDAYSAQHVGETLSIVVDQHVVTSPKIRVPITGNVLSIDAVDRSEANEIAAVINQGH